MRSLSMTERAAFFMKMTVRAFLGPIQEKEASEIIGCIGNPSATDIVQFTLTFKIKINNI